MDDISDFAYRLLNMAVELEEAAPEMWNRVLKAGMEDTAAHMTSLSSAMLHHVEKEEEELAEIKANTPA